MGYARITTDFLSPKGQNDVRTERLTKAIFGFHRSLIQPPGKTCLCQSNLIILYVTCRRRSKPPTVLLKPLKDYVLASEIMCISIIRSRHLFSSSLIARSCICSAALSFQSSFLFELSPDAFLPQLLAPLFLFLKLQRPNLFLLIPPCLNLNHL